MTTRTPNHEHVKLRTKDGAKVKVEETDDFVIVPDTVLTTDGVMNGARKTREDLARTWMLAEGRPVPHDHPGGDEFGLVIDLRRVGGFVSNVRFDDATGDVVADVYIAKRPIAGLGITEENIVRNRTLLAALRAGEPVELSIGFWSTDEWLFEPRTYEGPNKEFAGQVYTRVQREIVYDHVAIVPLGACGERCRLGSAQNSHTPAPLAHANNVDGTTMKPNQDCDKAELLDRLSKAESRADAAEQAAKTASADAKKVADLENKMNTLTAKLEAADKARLDGKRAELAALLVPKGADKATLDAKVAELDGTPEKALDALIAREKAAGPGHADGTRILRTAPKAEAKDGIQRTDYGWTAVAPTPAQNKPGVN